MSWSKFPASSFGIHFYLNLSCPGRAGLIAFLCPKVYPTPLHAVLTRSLCRTGVPSRNEAKSQRRARSHRPARVRPGLRWDGTVNQDRIAPVVEGDHLRQELCAKPVRFAGYWIDDQPLLCSQSHLLIPLTA